MEKCIGSYFFKNYQLMPTSSFTEHLTDISNGIYEVIRIINKVPLFWEEHMQRLNESLALKQLPLELSPSRILKAVEQLGTANDIINGNIKLLIISKANNADNPWDHFLYFTPHHYPQPRDYTEGVKVILFKAERSNPNRKIADVDLRRVIAEQLEKQSAYEALLVDPRGIITEGSRSNVFWIKEHCLYTSPRCRILPGITRQAIVQLCMEKNYPVLEREVSLDQISEMDAAFLTGTSPKVLPIKIIEDKLYQSASHPLVQDIMKAYDKMIDDYLEQYLINKWS